MTEFLQPELGGPNAASIDTEISRRTFLKNTAITGLTVAVVGTGVVAVDRFDDGRINAVQKYHDKLQSCPNLSESERSFIPTTTDSQERLKNYNYMPFINNEHATNLRSLISSATDFGTLNSIMDSLFKPVGINVSINDANQPGFMDDLIPVNKDIYYKPGDLDTIKQRIDVFVRALPKIPDVLFRKSTVRMISFFDSLVYKSSGAEAIVAMSINGYKSHGGFIIFGESTNYEDICHELFHTFDVAICGGTHAAARDVEFTKLHSITNPAGEMYASAMTSLKEELRAKAGSELNFVTTYAKSSVLEDKAETFKDVMSGGFIFADNPAHGSVLQQKQQILLARLKKVGIDLYDHAQYLGVMQALGK